MRRTKWVLSSMHWAWFWWRMQLSLNLGIISWKLSSFFRSIGSFGFTPKSNAFNSFMSSVATNNDWFTQSSNGSATFTFKVIRNIRTISFSLCFLLLGFVDLLQWHLHMNLLLKYTRVFWKIHVHLLFLWWLGCILFRINTSGNFEAFFSGFCKLILFGTQKHFSSSFSICVKFCWLRY